MKLKLIIFPIFLLFLQKSFSADISDSTSDKLFSRIIKSIFPKPDKTLNQPTLEFNYGFAKPSMKDFSNEEKLSPAYIGDIRYGFTRIYKELDLVDENLIYLASEFAFLNNYSSHLKPASIPNIGITQDNWRFGFGMNNGFGYKLKNSNFILYHSGAFVWSHIDFEGNAKLAGNQALLKMFDEKFRFGSIWEGGVKYQLTGPFYLKIGYEHSIVFPQFYWWKWFGSWTLENLSQRWLDFFETGFINHNPTTYPIYRFLIKNSLSLLLYELRREQMNWPFESEAPLNYDCFKMGITIIF
ncbi:MAG: hypothetical protein HW421_2594 [Ignavibacteria bacterium]|nr:hypothetical protein [Ignavibacteria bacterium]